MPSIAHHHAEWLSLLEISGPFLSMPVLLDALPQGLDAHDATLAGELRAAYEEWADNQGSLQPEPAIHTVWVRYVLETALDLEGALAEGQAIPEGIKAIIPEHGEVIRPDMMVLPPGGKAPRMLVQVYPPEQGLEKAIANRPWQASAATRMMELLYASEVRLGLVTNGEQWMLVHARRGETATFVSWYAGLWAEEPLTLRAFQTLLGVQRFFGVPDDQTLEVLIERSAEDQQEVTDQLGAQVRHAVEILIQTIDRIDQDRGRTLLQGVDESRLYESALTVMMRLVFLLCAEERGLLLLGDPVYDQHYAASTLRAQLREVADRQGEELLERRYDAWCRLLAVFRAVYGGIAHEDLRLPAYGGSLFDPDRFSFLEGRAPGTTWRDDPTQLLPIDNRTVLHLLEALQVLQVKVPGGGLSEARHLSFRALDIEQIGYVYQGLLDHVAVRAAEPVLGLAGTKDKEPEIPLPQLEAFGSRKGAKTQSQETLGGLAAWREDDLLDFLQEETGRSGSALRRALYVELEPLQAERLRAACGNDETLYRRVLPFAGLVREDDYGFPVVIPRGSAYVTAGATRRATGTHYTPRSLTEPIVQHTLEPLVYIGPKEGKPREQWVLRTPAELLALKICDMSMGSAAFQVQVCRYLSERLVEAWDALLPPSAGGRAGEGGMLQITPEGRPATGDPRETIIPREGEERLTLARRLVAERCLYGVDKNPLAVEIAKLSLWLITMDKGKPFTFLDHAFKCGDSLIGADEDTFLRWAQSLRNSAMPLFNETLQKELQTAQEKRRALQAFEVRDIRDAEHKVHLLAEADAAMARVKLGCDVLVGARFLDDLSEAEQDALLATALIDYTAGKPFSAERAQQAARIARDKRVFHWPFEFPEVFSEGGFSAFVGNPPFIGGRRIRETLGDDYREALYRLYPDSSGNADYCAFFFLRGFAHLQKSGTLGLIATNTIAQGDTRQTGLDQIAAQGGTIYKADNDHSWPGQAAVAVDVIHIAKGGVSGPLVLDEQPVQHISSLLNSRKMTGDPFQLVANEGKGHMGTNVVGLGFTLTPETANKLVHKDASNADVLFPYINGQDLNSSPDQSPSRWIINFFDWPLSQAAQYAECMAIVRERVYPERKKKKGGYAKYWWQYGRRQDRLYEAIAPLRHVLAVAQTTKYMAIAVLPKGYVYAMMTIIFALDEWWHFAVMSSSVHEAWVRTYASTLETRLRYTPRDVFETYPFPHLTRDQRMLADRVGKTYHQHRHQEMLDRQEGLTATYNRFHNPEEAAADIVRLRELHAEMDQAVAAAYGWEDLDLAHGFHETPQGVRFTISEAARWEVLDRLLALNHERHAEEVRHGLHEKKKKPSRTQTAGKKGANDGQLTMF